MKSKVFLFVVLFIVGRSVSAQEITKASVELRADYIYYGIDGKTIDEKTGFQGTFFNVCLAGKVSEHFGFDIRHRVNKVSLDKNFFNGTDKALMFYMPTEQWKFQVGKHSPHLDVHDKLGHDIQGGLHLLRT